MRMLQLGVRAVTARVAAGEPAVEKVILADVDDGRLRDVAAKLPPGKAETRGGRVRPRGAGRGGRRGGPGAERTGHSLGHPRDGSLP